MSVGAVSTSASVGEGPDDAGKCQPEHAGGQETVVAQGGVPIAESTMRGGQRFLINVSSNVGVFLLSGLLGMWYVPYLIGHIGIAAYGMVPLAMSVTNYLSILTLSLNGAVGRFLTIDLQKGEIESANRTFNTSLFGSLALAALLSPIVLGLVLVAPRIFDMPSGQAGGAQMLFAATMGTFLITTIKSPFSISSWAKNRFDLRNVVIAIDQIARVAIVVALFLLTSPQLWHVGLGLVVAAVIAFIGDVIVWKRLTPELRVNLAAFDLSRVRQLFSMGGWLSVNQVGTLLFLNIDLIVVNALLGAEEGGKYGAVLLWSMTLRALASTIGGVLTPTVLARYAQGDAAGMNRLSFQAVKLLGLALALPIGLICGLSAPFLILWLGAGFQDQAWLLVVMMIHLPINLAVIPLFGLQVTLNKVRLPGIVTLVLGVANLALAVVLAGSLGWGSIGVAMAGLIVLTAKNALFTSVYGAVIQNLPWWRFVGAMLPGILGTALVGLGAYALSSLWPVTSWFGLMGAGLVFACLYGILAYAIALDSNERRLLWGMLPVRV